MSEHLKCIQIIDGKQCNAYALTGKTLCFSHDPESREAKLEAVTKGGKVSGNRVAEPLTKVDVNAPKDVVTLLAQTISEVRSGELDQKKATTIGFIAGQLLKAFEVADEKRRIDTIEATAGIFPPKSMFRYR